MCKKLCSFAEFQELLIALRPDCREENANLDVYYSNGLDYGEVHVRIFAKPNCKIVVC